MTIIDRARLCLATRPGAISGAGGHKATFSAACLLVWGFGLEIGEAMTLLQEYNGRCDPPWTEPELLHKCRSALNFGHTEPRGHLVDDKRAERGTLPAYVPAPEKKKRKADFRLEALEAMQSSRWVVDADFLRARSPADPLKVSREDFLDALFRPGELVLVFNSLRTTGDFIRRIPSIPAGERAPGKPGSGGTFKLGRSPDDRSLDRVDLPAGSAEGMVFLIQPVDGKWRPVRGEARMSRRTRASITRFPYMLLESDKAPHPLWLNFIAQLRLPVVALATSGGRSIHALVKVDASSYDEWNDCAAAARELLVEAGCDGQALNPVVYMRFPGSFREGKMHARRGADGAPVLNGRGRPILELAPFPSGPAMQTLLYFNPAAAMGEPIGEGAIYER